MAQGSAAPTAPFIERHLGVTGDDLDRVLTALGVGSLEELGRRVLPEGIAVLRAQDVQAGPAGPGQEAAEPAQRHGALTGGLSEAQALAELDALAALNDPHVEMIGRGYHPCQTPAVIARDVLGNPAWTTSYTPYQAEISQGRLEAQLIFQTLVSDLTGLPVACTSLLDEATAVAEAVLLMARAARRAGSRPVLLDTGLHPQCLQVATARARRLDLPVVLTTPQDLASGQVPALDDGAQVLGAVLAHTTTRGAVQDLADAVAAVHARGGLVAVDADPLALTVLTEPGAIGADIAVGSAQRLGVPLLAGGPHPGFMAVTARLQRQLPGRIVGVSVDAQGHPAYRLALQTREQHIRRHKATSNICTAQALLAVVAAMYAVHHGPEGLRAVADHVHAQACRLAAGLTRAGVEIEHDSFFDTVSARLPGAARQAVERAQAAGYNLRLLDEDHVGVSTNETTTQAHVDQVLEAVTGRAAPQDPAPGARLPEHLRRSSGFLDHPVFHEHRGEVSLVRYLRRLADRDLALDRTMIPLGSCTLKLNAAVQSALWLDARLAGIHPYAPRSQTAGWRAILSQLATRLARLTGYDRVSLQPASGAQGELTGLLAITAYLRAQGQDQRDLCLVPASAHGTNAASAAGAGLRVKEVATAPDGTIDVEDLRAVLAEHGDRVAAIMLTYPSTHGVFEAQVTEVTRLVHEAGGQVYIDGANLNALAGLVRPADLGGDCSHLNLHKTFAIPHGGGGPGVGPVAVKEHLAPYLPAGPEGSPAPLPGDCDEGFAGPPVMGARFGSAGVMPLSWTYLATLTDADLRRLSLTAVASANYVGQALADSFPTLYTGQASLVAHECILDLRELTASTGVTAEDVAKRLIDYGFHAPTLSFPVAGTLMVEPTESEPLGELDRFIAAMRAIRAEIDQVARGEVPVADSVLRRSPHTLAQVVADSWDRPYPRSQAAPCAGPDAYFPPVCRVDNAWGDRHLSSVLPTAAQGPAVCATPAPSAQES